MSESSAAFPRQRAHVNNLPPELLLSVMKADLYETLDAYDADRPIRVPFDRDFSQVCRRWRAVALSCPELWSVVPLPDSNPEWTKLCLSRCANGSIDFVLPMTTDWVEARCQQAVKLVSPHLHRVRIIDLHLDVYDIANQYIYDSDGEYLEHDDDEEHPDPAACLQFILQSLSAQPAPLLEELNLSFCTSQIDWAEFKGPRLSSDLFARQPLPVLHTLRLACCITTVPSPLYASNLRHLELRDAHSWKNVDEMIQCLQATPLLECLICQHSSEFAFPPSFNKERSKIHPLRCVQLNRLTRLELEGTFSANVVIFSYLAIRISAKIDLKEISWVGGEIETHLEMLGQALTGHFGSIEATGPCFDRVTVAARCISARVASSNADKRHLLGKLAVDFPNMSNGQDDTMRFLRIALSLPVFRGARSKTIDDGIRKQHPGLADLFGTST